jgi:hypothetical protein
MIRNNCKTNPSCTPLSCNFLTYSAFIFHEKSSHCHLSYFLCVATQNSHIPERNGPPQSFYRDLGTGHFDDAAQRLGFSIRIMQERSSTRFGSFCNVNRQIEARFSPVLTAIPRTVISHFNNVIGVHHKQRVAFAGLFPSLQASLH